MGERSASLSFKQGIGILAGMAALMLGFSAFLATFVAVLVNMKKNGGGDPVPMIIGSAIGFLIILGMAMGCGGLSILLLRDPKGMYIGWLEKRFSKKNA